jgi:TetR/AcrR family transcriptional repressor of uid operon
MPPRPRRPTQPAPRTARAAAPADGADDGPSLSSRRRQQILDAAEQCFRERGFHGARMAEIAKTFGMSAGHIYNHFDSKEAIIAAIVERDVAGVLQRADELRGARDLQEAILDRIEPRVAERLDRSRSALQIEVLAEAARNPRVAATLRSADARVRAALRSLLRSASGSARDLDGKLTVLMALFDGLMIRALRQPEISRAQLTRALRVAIRALLRS